MARKSKKAGARRKLRDLAQEPILTVGYDSAELRRVYDWYRIEGERKQLVSWFRDNHPEFAQVEDSRFSDTAMKIDRQISLDAPIQSDQKQYLKDHLASLAKAPQTEQETKSSLRRLKKAPKKSVAQRVKDQVSELIAQVDGLIDQEVLGLSKFDSFAWIQEQGLKSKQIGMLRKYYDAIATHEYRHRSDEGATPRKVINLYARIAKDFAAVAGGARKSVKRKVSASKSASKMASKVSYLETYADMKLVSVDPARIVGASQVWLFDTNFNKLIVHYAADEKGLTLSRSAIRNFDKDTSVRKRIRRNKALVQKVPEMGKISLRGAMKQLNTTDEKPSGRITDKTIILKVVK